MRGVKESKLSLRKWLIVPAIAVVVFGAAAAFWLLRGKSGEQPPVVTNKTGKPVTTIPAETDKVIHLAMMGDMLAHDSVNAQAKTANGYDYKPYFTNIKPLYKDADVVFCNPETPVAGDTYGVSGYPTFDAPSAFARDLVQGAACNVINLASNHQADKGQAGIDASLDVWKGLQPYAYSGMNSSATEQSTVSYFTVKGVRFAFVAFMDFSNAALPATYSVNTYHNTALVQQLMTEARQNAQVVLVSAHWGVEDSNTVSASQKATAQVFADNGATLIIGTGPHVEQAFETVTASDGRSVPVWYSIGNMLSSQLGINGLTSGVALSDIDVSSSKPVVKNITFASTFMSYEWSAGDKAAVNLLARHNLKLQPLSEADDEIQAMFGANYSVAERKTYLQNVLGSSVTVQ